MKIQQDGNETPMELADPAVRLKDPDEPTSNPNELVRSSNPNNLKNQDLMGVNRSPRYPGGLKQQTEGLPINLSKNLGSGSLNINSHKHMPSVRGAKLKQITFSPTE